MELMELIEILRVLNDSPSLTPLHDEVMKLVLRQIKAALGQNLQHGGKV